MATISKESQDALIGFLNAFDEVTTGVWARIKEHMEEAGYPDPEAAMEKARQELQE